MPPSNGGLLEITMTVSLKWPKNGLQCLSIIIFVKKKQFVNEEIFEMLC